MALSNTHNLGAGASYVDQLIAEISNREGSIPLPYADQEAVSIGIGVNISIPNQMALVLDHLGMLSIYIDNINAERVASNPPIDALSADETNAIYEAIVTDFISVIEANPVSRSGDPGTSTSEELLQAALNAKMVEWFGDDAVTFEMHSNDQARAIVGDIITGYTVGSYKGSKQESLDRILGNDYSTNPDAPTIVLDHNTREYKALMSMFYNVETLIPAGGGLATAIQNDDRVAAWYEIAFRSNSPIKDRNGVSTGRRNYGLELRRLGEAEDFGLYDYHDPASPVDTAALLEEAKDIYRFLTLKYDDMTEYFQSMSTTFYSGQPNRELTAEQIEQDLWGPVRNQLNEARNRVVTDLNTMDGVNLDSAAYLSSDVFIDPGRDSTAGEVDANVCVFGVGPRQVTDR